MYNYALAFLGQNLMDFPDEESVEGKALGFFYPYAMRDVMGAYPWSFSVLRTRLCCAEAPLSGGYEYQFPLPEGLVRIVSVNGEAWSPECAFARIEGDKLMANTDTVDLAYTADPGDIQEWDPNVAQLVGLKLADLACIRITDNAALQASLRQRYELETARIRNNETRNNVSGRGRWSDRVMARENSRRR